MVTIHTLFQRAELYFTALLCLSDLFFSRRVLFYLSILWNRDGRKVLFYLFTVRNLNIDNGYGYSMKLLALKIV